MYWIPWLSHNVILAEVVFGPLQSCSRCVLKADQCYGDVSRVGPITVKEFKYAQSLTQKPVKGMLTGESCPYPIVLAASILTDPSPCACIHASFLNLVER